jgi:lipid-binding SYLF domain-containing protein
MKAKHRFLLTNLFCLCALFFINVDTFSQNSRKNKRIIADCQEAKEEFINVDGLMKNLFENAYGYVIFPNVGKGGFFIGGATGNGMVFLKGNIIGSAKLSQLSVGFQAGGQAYREVIFFEGEQELERFKRNNIELSAQASAVAVTAGASGNAKYENGVMIFTQTKGGLMYEASIGGQKFMFEAF